MQPTFEIISIYENSNSLGVLPKCRNEIIMRYFYIAVVRLVELQVKATGCKQRCNGEVELAVCQTNRLVALVNVACRKRF